MDPQQWLGNFEAKLADLQQKSADLQENYAAASATVTSRDGAVKVTVGPNGGLQNLELGHRATELGAARLTALIMETARTAQKQAATKVMEAFAPLGEGTEAMQFIKDSIPEDGPAADEDERDDYAEPEPEPQRPQTPPQPPVPPYAQQAQQRPAPAARPAARRPAEDDDENQPW
ncbi:YbaB/EbfC family nucleoid-associated protein [Actinosynnema mirum]|uniref:YbaB/EbfC DNA-binding family protein n=1 Tax=Actinosynnema mirum (strain ATCC 29888 / DSM 43827 / JCM 3225 / NBRC 14064 / NCIMB 13271 / NRRL B-12336 / IMRU 3971 / 101) TaxID=446462 RepID=C6WKK5_ACTMD|nr:YbaB/EbfC family nucleoid-associated protein [Actinosynnema mirum]ACU40256.1 hypothetical protein Amir_6455 [Actinosynnema mirum DSM 43827]AXX33766.1 hypothetical protein APASM_6401 [Actinosynnema pretiosum subsp. pretiosum]